MNHNDSLASGCKSIQLMKVQKSAHNCFLQHSKNPTKVSADRISRALKKKNTVPPQSSLSTLESRAVRDFGRLWLSLNYFQVTLFHLWYHPSLNLFGNLQQRGREKRQILICVLLIKGFGLNSKYSGTQSISLWREENPSGHCNLTGRCDAELRCDLFN